MPPIRSSSSDGLKVLIFDGGDLRSLSQIEILREYMRRIQFDTGEALRPHQVFDLVAGVGPAGILAFLLGGLGLTIEEASEQFDRLCRDLLLDDQLDTESRTEKLETLLKDMLRTAQIRENQKLCDPSSPACKTKIALYFMSSSNLGRCRVFRNYESRQYEYNPTILEALRATCSMPHLFMPICAGPDHHQEDLVTAMLGYNNPTKEVIRELLSIHGSSWRIQLILSIGAGKQAPLSIKGKGISLVEKAVQEAENVAEELREHLKKTGVYFRFSVDRGIETLEQAQGQQISTIYSSTSTYLSQKDVNESLDSAIKATFMSSLVTLERLNPYPSLVMKSSNGLPPLSAFFVMRQAPIDALVNGLLSVNSDDPRQRIMVVSGMGGSGKTQITLAFARANENWFRHILFVDASSAESIENSLIARGGAVDRALLGCTAKDVLSALSRPDEVFTTDWLLILDNADDPGLDIREFIPECDHGSVLITTRNPNLGNLTPNHLKLDVMTPEEAVDALLSAAFGPSSRRSERELSTALEIVETLGYLPVAVIQAGAMIKKQQCFYDYIARLKRNRSKLLQNPSLQRDKLRYPHSVYAAFDTTLKVLSEQSLRLLSILSFLHYTGLPRAVFGIAAKYDFKYQPYDIEERETEFEESAQLLTSILTRDGVWNEDMLDEILEELQQYSLVTLIPGYSPESVALRCHPLLHAWAQDRLSPSDRARFCASAVRIICGATHLVDAAVGNRLITHAESLTRTTPGLHINDQVALDAIQRRNGKNKNSLTLWMEVHQTVNAKYGPNHGRTALATLILADSYGRAGDRAKMEELEKLSVERFSQLYGPYHSMTLWATGNLARTYRENGDLDNAESLNRRVLEGYEKTELDGLPMSNALTELATTLLRRGRSGEARALVLQALKIQEKNLGRAHHVTAQSIQTLAATYEREGRYAEAEPLRSEVLSLQKLIHGEEGAGTLNALGWLALHHYEQKRYEESEKLFASELQGRRKVHGPTSENCQSAFKGLISALNAQRKYDTVDAVLQEELPRRRMIFGETHETSLLLEQWMAINFHAQKEYKEAEAAWRGLLEKRRSIGAAEPLIIRTLHGWGNSLFCLRRLEEAEHAWREEMERRMVIHGKQNTHTLQLMHRLGCVIFEQGRHKEAEQLWRAELDARRMLSISIDRDTADTLHSLSQALVEQEQYIEGEQLAREEINARLELHGPAARMTGDAYAALGFALLGQRKLSEAEEAFRENWDILRTVLGSSHEISMEAQIWVANALIEQGKRQEAERLARSVLDWRSPSEFRMPGGWHMLGQILIEIQYIDEAEKLLEEEYSCRKKEWGEKHAGTIEVRDLLTQLGERRDKKVGVAR